jgi:hypothetical protein
MSASLIRAASWIVAQTTAGVGRFFVEEKQ